MFGIGKGITAILALLKSGFVEGILDRVIGNKSDRDVAFGQEKTALLRQFSDEFRHLSGRTWIDIVIDVINRLPRPIFALSVIALLAYAPYDPPHFAAIMQAYALVPEWLAMVLAAIISFFFGGRIMDKWNGRMKPPSIQDVESVVTSMGRLREMSRKYRDDDADEDIEAQYKKADQPPTN